MHQVVEILEGYSPKIFRRIAVQIVAQAPDKAPDLAAKFLTDKSLIDVDWCRQEYGKLARAWFQRLAPAQQQNIFTFIDRIAEDYIDTWRVNFEGYYKRKADAEDDRKFRETTFRDVVWEWREVLPPDRRAAVEKTVAELGGRDSWIAGRLKREEPSLDRATMQQQPVDDTVAHLAAWQPEPGAQSRTVPGLALELRESVTSSPQLFSAGAAKFAGLRPVFIRQVFDGLRQSTANGVELDWAACLDLVAVIVARAEAEKEREASSAPGDDADWSWTLQSAVEWLAVALRRGAEGIPFVNAARVRPLVPGLYRLVKQFPAADDSKRLDPQHLYFSAIQTARGATIDLCMLLVFWQSKDTTTTIGQSPREALTLSPGIRSILEGELEDRSSAGWIPRAVPGRYLTWLFYFGEGWLREHFGMLFPAVGGELAAAAWLGHLHNDQPAGDLVDLLQPYYAFHIRSLERGQPPPGFEETGRRLAEYLMVFFLWEKLPDDLLQLFWSTAPASVRRHAMWFMGREMVPGKEYRTRAMAYWDARLRCAIQASDPEPLRNELGTIGQFFLWDIDQVWLLDQLLIMSRAGFAPNDAIGVVDGLAKLVPAHIDKVIEVTNVLVRLPKVEAWIFAAQQQSLRQILVEGKKSATPKTVSTATDIVSYLASRGNPSFLDLDD